MLNSENSSREKEFIVSILTSGLHHLTVGEQRRFSGEMMFVVVNQLIQLLGTAVVFNWKVKSNNNIVLVLYSHRVDLFVFLSLRR